MPSARRGRAAQPPVSTRTCPPACGSRRGGAALAVLLALGAVALAAAPALGHASSQLPHARWQADGTEVEVHWTAAADDVADVAVAAGLWPEEVMWAYVEGETDAQPTDEEITALRDEPALHDYLRERFEVRQAGEPCPAEPVLSDDVIADGLRLQFSCPEPVTVATLDVRVLHDRDPAYRTFSVDGTEQYAVHTVDQPEHTWDFTLAASEARIPLQLWLAGGAVLLAAVGVWLLLGRRRTAAGHRR